MAVPVPLDRFLRFDELTAVLQAVAAAHPDLVSLESIGRSYEGRDLWLVTITDTSTGPHDEKPAMWVDANIHATELTGSTAALALIDRLVTGYATDATVTRALRTRTFYVVPRVNPDGAEASLADRPKHLRSSVRPWPWADGWRKPGLHAEDIDGDGRILNMRVADPDGHWKPCADEPSLLVRRRPDDGPDDGPYYRVLTEGLVEDHDGFTIPTPRAAHGLDLNRNYPAGWGTHVTGSGDHPLSEPEIDAVARAMRARPNITGTNAYHTAGGVLLRPSSTKPSSDMLVADVWLWNELGARGTELTTYPVHSVYDDFTWDRTHLAAGAADDWAYEHLGLVGWTTEFWDVAFAATGTRLPTNWWDRFVSVETELAILRWFRARGNDAGGGHEAYVEWYPFEHPQLGPVELGGWDWFRTWENPPLDLLADHVRPHADFAVFQALAAPSLALRLVEADPMGDGVWRVRAGIANTGWLPTTITAFAAANDLVLPLVAEVTLPPGAECVSGPVRQELGQLGGGATLAIGGAFNDGTPERVLATWLVRGEAGQVVGIEARHQRAGVARASVTLG